MGKNQKIITTVLWTILVCAMLAIVAFGLWDMRPTENPAPAAMRVSVEPLSGPDLPALFAAPSFSLIDQNAKPITDADLRGDVWVAAFIFTHCAGPCPMMSSKMAELQTAVPEPTVKLVSFTVDPDRDTPQVLKEYARKFDADESRWFFVTGEKSKVYEFVHGMHLTAEPQQGGGGEDDDNGAILHDTRFLLVDQQGQVRGIYSINDPEEMKQLAADARTLAHRDGGGGGADGNNASASGHAEVAAP